MKTRAQGLRLRESTLVAPSAVDLLAYLERKGFNRERVCRAAKIDPAALSGPDARIPGSWKERLWAEAERLTADHDIGLHTAESYNPGALGVAGYVVLSCATAAQVIDRLSRYASLMNDGLRVRVSRQGENTVIVSEAVEGLDNYLERRPREPFEVIAASLTLTLSRLVNRKIAPREITFRHKKPPSISEHTRIFGLEPRFGAPENRIVFRSLDLEASVISADPALLKAFEQRADALTARLERYGPLSRRALSVLREKMKGVVPPLQEVASELAMSSRTVQRALRLEGTTYQKLVDEAQRDLAVSYLKTSGVSASEVAFLLGFSELSAFSRAFKRWTGSAPAKYRTTRPLSM
ncbi:MAG: AraC family transcriptional regulator [Vicinamibacteria bacterium]|nr:AraC family transcriptional regulator [Vicinamibacteria bacterium]